MATNLLVSDFRLFSKIGDSEPDTEIQAYLTIAENQVSRITATAFADLPDDPEVGLAVKLLALCYINQRSFPSKAIKEAVNTQVLSLLGGVIDTGKLTIYQTDEDIGEAQ